MHRRTARLGGAQTDGVRAGSRVVTAPGSDTPEPARVSRDGACDARVADESGGPEVP